MTTGRTLSGAAGMASAVALSGGAGMASTVGLSGAAGLASAVRLAGTVRLTSTIGLLDKAGRAQECNLPQRVWGRSLFIWMMSAFQR